MILPTKSIKPVDSLFCMASYVLQRLSGGGVHFDKLFDDVNEVYPKKITLEALVYCLDMLYLIDKVELKNEIIKAKF